MILSNLINFSDYQALQEARNELESALEDFYLLVRNDADDLPKDFIDLIPWLKSKKSLSEKAVLISSNTKNR